MTSMPHITGPGPACIIDIESRTFRNHWIPRSSLHDDALLSRDGRRLVATHDFWQLGIWDLPPVDAVGP